jgi:hypothetical protein
LDYGFFLELIIFPNTLYININFISLPY